MPEQPRLIAEERAEHTTARPDAERAAYVERLREKLRDPEFRKIEGFPIGDDEAILALSDPPYYTACPNPFLPEILTQWREERRQLRAELGLPDDSPPLRGEGLGEGSNGYTREPYATDVSEGKNDPIYNAHSDHTKVPHKAIMRYIISAEWGNRLTLDTVVPRIVRSFVDWGVLVVAEEKGASRVASPLTPTGIQAISWLFESVRRSRSADVPAGDFLRAVELFPFALSVSPGALAHSERFQPANAERTA